MGKAKVIETIAQRLAKTGKALPPGVAARSSTSGVTSSLDDMAAYERTQAQLDKANVAPATPQAVREEIAFKEAELAESTRSQHVSDPTVTLQGEGSGRFHQTNGPEEFNVRLNGQLNDPVYSVKNTLGFLDSTLLDDVIKSGLAHNKMQDRMLNTLRGNKRWGSSYDNWAGDSPYKDRVLFHVDKQTDPTRADSFIQFESPRELGLHAGTNAAAERVVGFSGIEGAIQASEDLVQQMDELAGFANIEPKHLNRVLGRELENFFEVKFNEGRGYFINSEEWNGLVDRVSMELGADAGKEAERLFAFLKEQPTPSTTPMVFRGQNGLLMLDEGNFRPSTVAEQLLEMFPDDADEILSIGRDAKGQQKFIESKGYDHVVYHNSVEDKGSLSIINWNPELQRSVWDAEFTPPGAGGPKAQAASFMAAMGIGGASATLRDSK